MGYSRVKRARYISPIVNGPANAFCSDTLRTASRLAVSRSSRQPPAKDRIHISFGIRQRDIHMSLRTLAMASVAVLAGGLLLGVATISVSIPAASNSDLISNSAVKHNAFTSHSNARAAQKITPRVRLDQIASLHCSKQTCEADDECEPAIAKCLSGICCWNN